MIGASRSKTDHHREPPIHVIQRFNCRKPRNDRKRDGAEPQGEMRALADLVQKPGGEQGKEEGDPEGCLERLEPNAGQTAKGGPGFVLKSFEAIFWIAFFLAVF